MSIKRYFYILILISLIISPSLAWTQVEDYDFKSYSNTMQGSYFWGFYVSNITAFSGNITKIENIGAYFNTANDSHPLSGSYSASFKSPYPSWSYTVGNGTISYTCVADAPPSEHYKRCNIILEISDFNRGSLTGPQAIKLVPSDSNFMMDGSEVYDVFGSSGVGYQYATFVVNSAFDGSMYGDYKLYTGSGVVPPTADFTCTPTSQFPSSDVVCTDISTGTPTDWFWSIDAEVLGIHGWQTSTSRNFTWQSAYPGLYSVNLRANNSAGSDWENKTDYVSISANATPNNCDIPPLSGYQRTEFQCTDADHDAAISGCNIQIRDLEGGSWSNATDIADGYWCIDTLPAHHVSGYADATGYTSGSLLNMDTWPTITRYSIKLIPGYIPAPQAGKIWVYIYVDENGINLPGVTVSVSGTGQSTQSGTTDSSGGIRVQWPNSTEAYINAAKAGYTTGSRVITTSPTGPDIVYISLHKGTSTATMVPTTGPGGTVAPTLNPNKDPSTGLYVPGYANQQGQQMMGFLAENGMSLLMLCVLATMMGLIKMMTK